MLRWAVTFFIIALIAGAIGLTNVAGASSNIAYYLAVGFLILFVVSLVMGRGAAPPV